MNNKARKFKVKPCVVCDYQFSDTHHLFAQRSGGKKGETLFLCPNHHRFANMIQSMVDQEVPYNSIVDFANRCFDAEFNRHWFRKIYEAQRLGHIDNWLRRWFFDGLI